MITIDQFRTRFPEYCDQEEYTDDRIQMFIDDTVTLYMGDDESRWCDGKYNIAQAYLTAHLLKIAEDTSLGDANAKAGPISSKTAGGVSVTRSVATKDRSDADDFYTTTAYGQQYVIIRDTCFAPVLVTGQC